MWIFEAFLLLPAPRVLLKCLWAAQFAYSTASTCLKVVTEVFASSFELVTPLKLLKLVFTSIQVEWKLTIFRLIKQCYIRGRCFRMFAQKWLKDGLGERSPGTVGHGPEGLPASKHGLGSRGRKNWSRAWSTNRWPTAMKQGKYALGAAISAGFCFDWQ